MVNNPIHLERLRTATQGFHGALPFEHCVIDGFLDTALADQLDTEFLPFDSPKYFIYKNPLEDKKALNDWNAFSPATYSLFQYLVSIEFVSLLSELMGEHLYCDPGLHGGGWHIHGSGGNLNPHLDYSVHPKLGLQRKLNLIIYLGKDLREEHGGHLGLWSQVDGGPGALVQEIAPRFNRAVLFNTTQQSWHGMSRNLTQPAGIYRKSLAVYYLCDPPQEVDPRNRALYAPREHQKNDPAVLEIIQKRADLARSEQVYTMPDTSNATKADK
jgi:Rps23 Pro-64 3,4-dihydroxylase Tpa1-like proline 4-hydroxylase